MTTITALRKMADKTHFWVLDLQEFQRNIDRAAEKDRFTLVRLGMVLGGVGVLIKALRGFIQLLSDALTAEERRG